MAVLTWDDMTDRLYETGVDQCVLYPYDAGNECYGEGVAWNGIISITESPSGAEASPLYADNIKYLNLISNEDFGLTIEAYTYPDEFAECDGSKALIDGVTGVTAGQQERKMFALCYRTRIGNAAVGDSLGYKYHIVYGCKASPSERAYNTVNDSPEAGTFSWEVSTTPIEIGEGFRKSAHIEIDSTKVSSTNLTSFVNTIYGSTTTTATCPMPEEVIDIFSDTP